jgi:hypothetical protein
MTERVHLYQRTIAFELERHRLLRDDRNAEARTSSRSRPAPLRSGRIAAGQMQ